MATLQFLDATVAPAGPERLLEAAAGDHRPNLGRREWLTSEEEGMLSPTESGFNYGTSESPRHSAPRSLGPN